MFNKKNIRNRVMEVIEAKIKNAQVRHDEEVKRITDEYKAAIIQLDKQLEDDKRDLEDTIVNEIISKVI